MQVCVCLCIVCTGSLGPGTWIPWAYAMAAAIVLFALNGVYQHNSWWKKGGKETVFMDVDPLDSLPSMRAERSRLGGSFQVRSCRSSRSSRSLAA